MSLKAKEKAKYVKIKDMCERFSVSRNKMKYLVMRDIEIWMGIAAKDNDNNWIFKIPDAYNLYEEYYINSNFLK